jgi:hypothetical protein
MTTVLEGKGFYIWKIERCENGDVNAIADLAQQARLTHVLIKIADGAEVYNPNRALAGPLADALRARGIAPWGWQYVYGYEPESEARAAIKEIKRLGLKGFVVNAESQYKQPGRAGAARRYMNALQSALPNTPFGLSSYRYPSYHRSLPWREFLEMCDVNVPQVYWQGSSNPALQLQRSTREFSGMAPIRPIVPTGAAYSEHGWKPKVSEVQAFMEAAKANHLTGVNFWEWSTARHLGYWDTIAKFPWTTSTKEKDIAEKYIAALNTRNARQMVNLYSERGVHVNAARTVQGTDKLFTWYMQLFTQVLPSAVYKLTGYSGTGNSRHITWTAVSANGRVENGNDTFMLGTDGKIHYHYNFFTIEK